MRCGLVIASLLLFVRVTAGQKCDLPNCQSSACTEPTTFFPSGSCPDLTCTAKQTCKFIVSAPAVGGRMLTCNEGATCQVNATKPQALSGKFIVTWTTAKLTAGSYNLELNCLGTGTCNGSDVTVSPLSGTLALRCSGSASCTNMVLDCQSAIACAVDCTSHPKACVDLTIVCKDASWLRVSASFNCGQTAAPTTAVPTTIAPTTVMPTLNPCSGWVSFGSDIFPHIVYATASADKFAQCTCGVRIALINQCEEAMFTFQQTFGTARFGSVSRIDSVGPMGCYFISSGSTCVPQQSS